MLREGKSITSTYTTSFLILWPEHLGGGESRIDLKGSMVLIPSMGMT